MAKLALFVTLISIMRTISWAQTPANDLKWAKRLVSDKDTVTNLEFYFHDTPTGLNPSVVKVAEASTTKTSLTLFGSVMMADDPLTEGPDPSSKLIGRARGLYGSAAQNDVGLIMALNYGFVDGMYNGSSISILGLNSALLPVREMAVVGGTGLFRLARGYAIAKTYWLNPITGNAIVGYNVTVIT